MDFRPGGTPAVGTVEAMSASVAPQTSQAVTTRIAGAVQSAQRAATRWSKATARGRLAGWWDRDGRCSPPAHPGTFAVYVAADICGDVGELAAATFGGWAAAADHRQQSRGQLSPSAHKLVTVELSGNRTDYAAVWGRARVRRATLLVDDGSPRVDSSAVQ